MKDKPSLMKELVGNRKFDTWETFKASFVENQSQYNVSWRQAQGGTLYLESLTLTEDMGYEMGNKLIDKLDSKGVEYNIYDYIKEYIPEATNYVGDNGYIVLREFREGFKAVDKKNFSFKFKQGRNSSIFIKTTNIYTFVNKEGSQDEILLGNEILSELKSITALDSLEHTQTERTGGKYQNYDFIGFKRETNPFKDHLEIYTFELKPSNKIEYVSDAISQAINYKTTSDYVYIVIPMFDTRLFHDEARFDTYYEICRDNGLGIITIEIDTSKHRILSVYEVLNPKKNEISDYSLLGDIMREKQMELCPLCRRVVIGNEERKGCGWLSDRDSKCMKRVFEERLTL
ncbi:hypothetical protein EHQ53_15085 [Leptospira langatensis]|uniref:Uncharacterized protein n=1 Tax=Leptospira langatensis TaxID=2484983 RepID=A0A5F1ZSB8_9LEPT|nr:hypothetical protein [Leptospira langatensis]TGK01798.1 hypothetical protein EHO57_08325 [Leptospira langatensis]TGL39405.1 hypothetical protein EHQ53_15085 [Leptospira langatensis]